MPELVNLSKQVINPKYQETNPWHQPQRFDIIPLLVNILIYSPSKPEIFIKVILVNILLQFQKSIRDIDYHEQEVDKKLFLNIKTSIHVPFVS